MEWLQGRSVLRAWVSRIWWRQRKAVDGWIPANRAVSRSVAPSSMALSASGQAEARFVPARRVPVRSLNVRPQVRHR